MNTEEKIKQRCKEDQNAKPETVNYAEYSKMIDNFKDRWTLEEFSYVTDTYRDVIQPFNVFQLFHYIHCLSTYILIRKLNLYIN